MSMDKMGKETDRLRLSVILITAISVLCLLIPAICEETVWWFPDRLGMSSDGETYDFLPMPGKWIVAGVALLRCGILPVKRKATDVIALLLAVVCALWIAVMPVLMRACQPMGGLAGYDYWLAFFGWVLLLSNIGSAILTIILLNRKR